MDVFWLAKKALPNPIAKPPKGAAARQRRGGGQAGSQRGGNRAAAPCPRSPFRKAMGTGLGVLFLACLAAVFHSLGKGTADSTLFMSLGVLGGATWLVRR